MPLDPISRSWLAFEWETVDYSADVDGGTPDAPESESNSPPIPDGGILAAIETIWEDGANNQVGISVEVPSRGEVIPSQPASVNFVAANDTRAMYPIGFDSRDADDNPEVTITNQEGNSHFQYVVGHVALLNDEQRERIDIQAGLGV